MAVNQIQETARISASDMISGMNTFLSQLLAYSNIQGMSQFSWTTPGYIEPYYIGVSWLTKPSLDDANGIVIPEAPSIAAVELGDVGASPEMILADPAISLPSAPSSTLPSVPTDAPVFEAPLVPSAPTITWPDTPVFEPVAIPDAPNYVEPTFEGVLPSTDIGEPTVEFNFVEPQYRSDILDALKSKVLDDLQNGGYGIEPADELQLWDRAREREQENMEQALEEVTREAAARGFDLPSGALIARIDAVRQESARKLSSVSRDIALKRSELYVQNRQFAIEQARSIETLLIQYHMSVAERALNSAKAVVDAGVAVFNARVAKLNVQLETYRVSAGVFEAKIRAALAHLEAYKAKVEGAQLASELQKNYVAIYAAQVAATQAMADVYKTQVQASVAVVEIENAKLEAFKTRVQTYAAQVAAKSAEFDMYAKQIEGERIKVEVHRESVNAFTAQVSAYESRVRAATAAMQAKIASNSLVLDTYKTQLQGALAQLSKANTLIDAKVKLHDADVAIFRSNTDALVSNANSSISVQRANAEVMQENARVALGALQAQTSFVTDLLRLNSENSKAGAQTYAQVASSFANAVAGLEAQISTA